MKSLPSLGAWIEIDNELEIEIMGMVAPFTGGVD